jgi:hypothetical protein
VCNALRTSRCDRCARNRRRDRGSPGRPRAKPRQIQLVAITGRSGYGMATDAVIGLLQGVDEAKCGLHGTRFHAVLNRYQADPPRMGTRPCVLLSRFCMGGNGAAQAQYRRPTSPATVLRVWPPSRCAYGMPSSPLRPAWLTPLELIERLAVLIPPPRRRRHRCYGVGGA